MGYVIQFCVNLFDLGVFWYYLHAFKKRKPVPVPVCVLCATAMAAVWAVVNELANPYLNLLTLIIILLAITLFFEIGRWSRLANTIAFIGAGMVIEPIGLVLLSAMHYETAADGIQKYYFVVVLCAFIRGNVLYLLSKILSAKKVRFSRLPKEITGVMALTFGFSILNCCFVTLLAMETANTQSMILCISIIVSITLTYYFMMFMMERYNYLERRRHEDELYVKEMHYKEVYYSELEKQNKYVHKLKHDMKNMLLGFHYFLEKGDMQRLSEGLNEYCKELGKMDESSYSDNPIVDTVLRTKLGVAKTESIKVETSIRIPKQMQLEHGDIGVLYGNLLDNAIEACCKVEPDKRFIRIENKFTAGKMLLIIENSKTGERNEELKTTKGDSYSHGHGIHSVRKVVDKYNGTIIFTDKGEVFEVSAMLYGIEVRE